MPLLRRLIAGFTSRRPGFDPSILCRICGAQSGGFSPSISVSLARSYSTKFSGHINRSIIEAPQSRY
jgi:hypothetical protein